jgi:hypothetical protein
MSRTLIIPLDRRATHRPLNPAITDSAMDFNWIHLPIFTPDGYPMHDRGRAPAAPGLYFVGLPLQRSLSSSTLVGVGRDATLVADWISKP